MAKKKAGRKPIEGPTRDALITMRCTETFKEWLEGIAKAEDRQSSVVIERALKAYAEANGYKAPPIR